MVQRDQRDTYWGAKKIIFLIRAIDDATKAGASVESCRLAAQKPSGSRFGSVLDMCNRLRRLRRRFQINMADVLSAMLALAMIPPSFRSALGGEPQERRMRRKRLPDPRPIPEESPGPIWIQKK